MFIISCKSDILSLVREEHGLTFISQYSNSDGEEGTQHIEQSYGGLQRPFILTLGALGALLDPCVKTMKDTT